MHSHINTTPITTFAQILRAAELSQQKDIKISIQQARLISVALLEIMDKINLDYERLYDDLKNKSNDSTSINMDGGKF